MLGLTLAIYGTWRLRGRPFYIIEMYVFYAYRPSDAAVFCGEPALRLVRSAAR
jgi:hypothetical protein